MRRRVPTGRNLTLDRLLSIVSPAEVSTPEFLTGCCSVLGFDAVAARRSILGRGYTRTLASQRL
jgi:hypothetical protein